MQNIIEHIRNSGYSNESIAKKAGIQPERLTSIMTGLTEPNMSEVRKIAKALKLPTNLLISNTNQYEEINVLFRQAVKSNKERQSADKISYFIGNALSLLDNYRVNDSFFKNLQSLANTFNNARLLAAKFREFYCNSDFFTPLLHLPRLVSEELKCVLFIIDLGNDTDGASAIINKVPFIFLSPSFEPRMLFTLAHELAHVISHHNSDINFAKVDKHITELGRNQFKDEAFANAFASELLMPEEAVGVTLIKLRKFFNNTGPIGDVEIIHLSRIYGVSFDVAAKRCEDLNLLPTGGAVSLSEQIKKEFGSAEKRAEALNLTHRPKIIFPKVSSFLIDSAINKIYNREISIGKASEILSVPMSELMNHNTKQ